MAFELSGLTAMTHQAKRGQASTLWSYWTLDAAATVDTAGYFNAAANTFTVGDIIERTSWTTAIGAQNGGTISTQGRHIVNSISAAGIVDVTDTTASTVTDTD